MFLPILILAFVILPFAMVDQHPNGFCPKNTLTDLPPIFGPPLAPQAELLRISLQAQQVQVSFSQKSCRPESIEHILIKTSA